MKRILLSLVCVSALLCAACNKKTEQTAADQSGSTAQNQVTVSGITLQWTVDAGNLTVKLSAPTTGWVAVGFNPGVGMQDADIIIGYVNNGAVSIRDDFGTGPNSHNADTSLGGADNITNKIGTETNGVTELTFTIPLNSGDSKDQLLVVGNTYRVILAYGSSDDFTAQHTARTAVNIKIQ